MSCNSVLGRKNLYARGRNLTICPDDVCIFWATSGYVHSAPSRENSSAVVWRTVGKPFSTSQRWVAILLAQSSTVSGEEMANVVPTAANSSR